MQAKPIVVKHFHISSIVQAKIAQPDILTVWRIFVNLGDTGTMLNAGRAGASQLLGTGDVPSEQISNLSSNRRIVDPRGIFQADVVLIPLEDGDRAETLVAAGKTIITIDLNPLSRTAQKSHVTIVDNLIRVIPKMIKIAQEFTLQSQEAITAWLDNFDQRENLNQTIKYMINYLNNQLKSFS